MKLTITKDIMEAMLIGSSVYSTGGGFEYSVQRKLFARLLASGRKLVLISADELQNSDFVCTAYGVGSAGNTDFDLSKPLKTGLDVLERFTNKRFKAIFAGETNIDVLSFQAASNMNLPVLDADCTGGRAVPEIVFDNFVVTGKEITPLVAVTLEGEVAVLVKSKDGSTIEKFVRTVSTNSKQGVVAVLDHPIDVKVAKEVLTQGIFSRSIALGKFVLAHRGDAQSVEKMAKQVGGKILIQGRVAQVDLTDDKNEGFLKGNYSVTDDEGNTVKVFVKNENILCLYNGRVSVSPPDFIMTIDAQTLLGVHNSKIRDGQEVVIMTMDASPLWRSAKGKKVFNAKHFGFDVSK